MRTGLPSKFPDSRENTGNCGEFCRLRRLIGLEFPAFNPRFADKFPANRNHWAETVHTDDREIASSALERVLAGEFVVQEYRIVRPDRTVRWIRDTLFPIRDQYGRVERVGGIAQDITIDSGSRVYIVNGEEDSRQSLSLLLQRAGYSVKVFVAGLEFTEVAPVLALGCVVLDTRPSSASGLALLKQVKARKKDLPVVVIGTSRGDVKFAVEALKAGAVDWLEVPFEQHTLLAAVASALADIRQTAQQNRDAEFARARISGLSTREQQVLEWLLAGGTNKVIGKALGISPRTVELHRANVMERLGARTLPEAVLIAAAAGIRPADPARKRLPR